MSGFGRRNGTAARATVPPVLRTGETLKVPLFQAQWQTRQVRREAEPDARCAVARLMAGMGLRTIVRGKVAKNNNPRRFRAMAADVTPRILQYFPLSTTKRKMTGNAGSPTQALRDRVLQKA